MRASFAPSIVPSSDRHTDYLALDVAMAGPRLSRNLETTIGDLTSGQIRFWQSLCQEAPFRRR
jgi:hypothetical protein